MKKLLFIVVLLSMTNLHAKSIYSESITGLLTPESVLQTGNGGIYVPEINEFDFNGDRILIPVMKSGTLEFMKLN